MTAAEIKEIISFLGIGLLVLAMILIHFSRRKLKGFLGVIGSIIAYICFILGAIIVVYIVLSGPTG